MRRLASLTSAVAFCVAAGCTALVDMTGLTSGPVAGDAGAPQDAGAAADGSPAPLDASPEAEAAAGSRFCAGSTATLCADFDGPDLFAGWPDVDQAVGGTLTATPSRLGSQQNALLAWMPRRETATGYAAVSKTVVGPWREVVLTLDVYLEKPLFKEGDVNAGIVCISYHSGDLVDGACMSISALSASFGPVGGPVFPYDRWVRARYTASPATKSSSATFDGVVFVSGGLDTPGSTDNPSTQVTIGILGYNKPAPAFSAKFDNVTIEIR